MKRPRQAAVRQNAGPLALFSFVVNVTASFFRQFSRHISTWEKELNRRRQTLKPLENQGFFRLSLLYRNGTPSPPWRCKTAWTSRPSAVCSATTPRASHWTPTPTSPPTHSSRRRKPWGASSPVRYRPFRYPLPLGSAFGSEKSSGRKQQLMQTKRPEALRFRVFLARREGFEPPAFWSVARRSIQLS